MRDNGVGFDTGSAPGISQVGMNIMRERAGSIGAKVEFVSTPSQGTTTVLTLPAHPATHAQQKIMTETTLLDVAGQVPIVHVKNA